MIEFDPGEKIQTASIGDSLGWQVTPNRQANVLFLKPMSPSNTNLTVLTDQRRYAFELQVTQREAHEPVLYIARMVYPAPQKAISVLPQPETPPKVANNAYAMSGSKAEQPLRIFDDGHMTYFEWAPDAALPAIFALSGDGSESLVNCIIRGPYVVVDQLARGFVLRNGKDVAKIANHGPATAALP
jgi:type IV secretion system protein VirB9